MKAEEFTAKRRKMVRLPDGSEFVIRRIGVMDVLIAGGNPDLSIFTNGKSPAERLRAFADKSAETLKRIQKDTGAQRKFCESVILRGVVDPRVTPKSSDDTVAVFDFTFEECDMLAGAILKFSGLAGEAAEQVAPLSATEISSSSSTPPQPDMGAVRAGSSEQGISRATPSTSLAPALVLSERKGSSSA